MKSFRGIYLASYKACHANFDIDYQDINGKRDIAGDMLDIDLEPYDYIIATPPCNYWSRANYRRETSKYAQQTKHLLPEILDKLKDTNKPYIVENVINKKLMQKYDLFSKAKYIYFIGRHTYFTNIDILDIDYLEDQQIQQTVKNLARTKRQGDQNVHIVIDYFIKKIHQREKIKKVLEEKNIFAPYIELWQKFNNFIDFTYGAKNDR